MTSVSEDFQQVLKEIGGKSNVYLISAGSTDGDAGLLQDLIADVFDDGARDETIGNINGEIKTTLSRDPISLDQSNHSSIPAHPCTHTDKTEALKNKSVILSNNVSGNKRSIKCCVIIFVFTHDYVCRKDNHVCLREILNDVRARVKKNARRPALLGLVHADSDRTRHRDSVDSLDRLLRTVFINHTQDAIWTGHYVTKAPEVLQDIKRNACKAVSCALSAESIPGRKGSSFWAMTCLPIFKKDRGLADITSGARQQAHPQTAEEGVPLQMRSMTR